MTPPSKEVRDATGEAPERKKAKSAVELLQEKRQSLVSVRARYEAARTNRDEVAMADASRLIATLTVILVELEQEAAGALEQEALQKAKERVLGISRAVGSVVASMVEDRERVLEAARTYAEAVNRLNERFVQYQGLVAEDVALRDRFGIAGAKISHVTSPNETASVVAAARVVEAVAYASDRISRPQTEQDEHKLRERRTYGEIGGTAAYTIIQSAGLKPWRPLSEREQESIAALGKEKETNTQFLGELEVAATIAHALGTAGVPGGDVHRG
jgi:hypothetical protein